MSTSVLTPSALATLARREGPSMAHTITSDIGIAISRAQGCRVWDEDGREYLDLTAGSGVLALGHGHPATVEAMREQLGSFAHGGWQFSCPSRSELTESLAAILPWEDPVLLWCTTGSEAVEAALKVARAASGRRQALGFLGGYHGKTAGALTVTANASFRSGVTEIPGAGLSLPYPAAPGYVRPDAEPTTGHQFGQQILDHPDFGSSEVAGIVVECVQGAGGMQAAAPGFLTELRTLTRRHSMLLIVDEIFTGFGRTGATFGFDHEGVVPDLLVLGKALGGGLPVSVVAGPRELLGGHVGEHAVAQLAHVLRREQVLQLRADRLVWRPVLVGERARADELRHQHRVGLGVGVGEVHVVEQHLAHRHRAVHRVAQERHLHHLAPSPARVHVEAPEQALRRAEQARLVALGELRSRIAEAGGAGACAHAASPCCACADPGLMRTMRCL